MKQALLPTQLHSATSAFFPATGTRQNGNGPETYFDAGEIGTGNYEPVMGTPRS
jgi:hypothetical protein